jgi:hypothetical protein
MPTDLVTVAVLDNPEQAALARNLLDAAGIPAYLADENMVGMAWHMGGAVGGIKLQVAAEDEEDARALLDKDFVAEPDTAIAQGPSPLPDRHRHAIAAGAPGIGRSAPDVDDDDDESPPTLREKNAKAALRMSIIGLVFPPLLFVAFYLLFQIVGSDERLEEKPRRDAWIAAVVLGIVLLLVFMLLFPPPPPKL